MTACTWELVCGATARHRVWRETQPGLVVREAVCDEHLAAARRWGYRPEAAPAPPPDGR